MTFRSSSVIALTLMGWMGLQAAETAASLHLKKWSGNLNIPDPVAVTVDPEGRVYVTQTTRRKVGDLDIRDHRDWIEKDVSLASVEEKRAFYHDILAPGKGFKPRGGLQDHNQDGSVDWKDLTVHSEIIYRLVDTDGDGIADEKKVFADGFNTEVTGIAAGILYHDGWIYTTIAPDLWRLKDTDGDGVADLRESIVHGFGNHIAYAGHDMHGLTVGPDGRIYWTIGDKGTNVTSKEGKVFKAPHEGALLRCDPDGSNFEIFAYGLRNVQEIAFDDFGNIFGVDNDADKSGEKERILYITEGSDSGWRCHYQYMAGYLPWMEEKLTLPQHPDQPAYLTPALTSYHDGPAGFGFNPGTALGKAYQGRFFSNQFPSGKMSSFTLKEAGAGFALDDDALVSQGVMGIGMSWHPDGSLLMADWMGGYPLDELGAVWQLDVKAADAHPRRAETLKLLQQDYAKAELASLLEQLQDEDQRVRRGAQFELVKRQAFEALQEVAENAQAPLLARVHAIWGLGQGWRAQTYDLGKCIENLLDLKQPAQIVIQAAKVLADTPHEVPAALKLHVLSMLKHDNAKVKFQVAMSLGKLGVHSAFEAIAKEIELNDGKDPFLRHAFAFALHGTAKDAKSLAALASAGSEEVRLSAVVALRRAFSPEVAAFLQDSSLAVRAEAARAIYDDESIEPALPALASLIQDSQIDANEALARRVLAANFRLGQAQGLEALVKYSLREDAPKPLREAALVWVDQWVKPSALDLMDGAYRKLEVRSAEVFKEVLTPQMNALLSLKDDTLKALAITLLANHALPVEPALAAAAVLDPKTEANLRAKTLVLLAQQAQGSELLKATLENLLGSKAPHVLHAAALDAMAVEQPMRLAQVVSKVMVHGEAFAQQRGIALLGKATDAESLMLLEKLFGEFESQTLRPELHLEVVEAVAARHPSSTQLTTAWGSYQKKFQALAATPSQGEFAVLLMGGDAERGKNIVNEHLAANCIACHRVSGSSGSTVGPALNQIAAKRDRAHLLQSLIEPNADVTMGYGVITLTTKGGDTLAGSLLAQDKSGYKVRLSDGKEVAFKKEEVASMTAPVSVMPPMSLLLNKHEIRDVVEFLSTLKPKPKPGKTR